MYVLIPLFRPHLRETSVLELAEEQPYRRRFLKQRKEKREMNDTIDGAVLVTDNDVKMLMIYDLNVNGKQPNKMINLSYFR